MNSRKVEWCFRKAEKEMNDSSTHRGLLRVKPDLEKARNHVQKAEHYLKATMYLKNGDFSDISASTIFYATYHCFLAILAREGYESRNQECTFALIQQLIDENLIDFDKKLIDNLASFDSTSKETSIHIRERFQYGTELHLGDDIYQKFVTLAKEVITQTKLLLEQ